MLCISIALRLLGKNSKSILLFPAAPTGAAVFVIPPAPCRPDRHFVMVSGSRTICPFDCHPERAKQKDLPRRLTLHRKEEWKTAHANKNAFAAFSIPLFFIQLLERRTKAFLTPQAYFLSPRAAACCPGAAEGPASPVILHVTSSGSREVC